MVGAGGTTSVIEGQLVTGAQDKIKIINQEKRPESNRVRTNQMLKVSIHLQEVTPLPFLERGDNSTNLCIMGLLGGFNESIYKRHTEHGLQFRST